MFKVYIITGKSIKKNATLYYKNCIGPESRWYLNLWFFNDFCVGQNLSQMGQLYPLVSTCLASTCSYSLVLYLTVQPQVRHLQTPSNFSIWDSTAVFSSDRININITKYLFPFFEIIKIISPNIFIFPRKNAIIFCGILTRVFWGRSSWSSVYDRVDSSTQLSPRVSPWNHSLLSLQDRDLIKSPTNPQITKQLLKTNLKK